MSRKCLFLAKWTILAQLGAKIVGGLYHRTHSKSFSNFEAWYDAMIRKKLSVLNFQKKPLLDKMGNCADFYIRICTKDFFQTLQHDRAQ